MNVANVQAQVQNAAPVQVNGPALSVPASPQQVVSPVPVNAMLVSPPLQPLQPPGPVIVESFQVPKHFGPWNVQVTVVKGYALPKMDLLGKIDAFVTVFAGGKHLCSTPVITKEYNPIWNHSCPAVGVQTYGEGAWLCLFC